MVTWIRQSVARKKPIKAVRGAVRFKGKGQNKGQTLKLVKFCLF